SRMPMLEVFYSGNRQPDHAQKQAFTTEAGAILQRVIGTPPGRLQLIIQIVSPENTLTVIDLDRPDGDTMADPG
ncbi:tautomerase family protein, partial [Chloroflexus sp.]|uniref:tautomerase family protein n=2 Tax=Chloroflexus sp. TaxID=1904827 RepID=UPI00404B74CE